MKPTLCALLALACAAPAWGSTTIDPVNKFAYAANAGWINWEGDGAHGAEIGQFFCAGSIFAANLGWIHLGGGAPLNGVHYQNNSATDYGVNHDGAGHLSGQAWGANVGWLTFGSQDANGSPYDGPKVDLLTGILSGNIWGANIGWISLSNAQAFVQTSFLKQGPDSDKDGLPDAWELQFSRDLKTLGERADADSDGLSDAAEYQADTDPLDPRSLLLITGFNAGDSARPAAITWTSQPTRLYRVLGLPELNGKGDWADVGLGAIVPDPGPATTRMFDTGRLPQSFFRIEAFQPLPPSP